MSLVDGEVADWPGNDTIVPGDVKVQAQTEMFPVSRRVSISF
jgi:hypothetical protein